jgi:hypothetical protein
MSCHIGCSCHLETPKNSRSFFFFFFSHCCIGPNILLDWSDVCKPKIVKLAKQLKKIDKFNKSCCKGFGSVLVKKLFSCVFLRMLRLVTNCL